MTDDAWADAERNATVIRPIPSLPIRWIPAIAAGALPLFVALLWLTEASGWWVLVCALALFFAGGLAFAYAAFRGARVIASEAGVRVAGLLGRKSVPASAIASTMLAEVHRADGPGTRDVLLVVGHDDRPVLRLDGIFWSREVMTALAEALDAPETVIGRPIARDDLHRMLPGAARWFERVPFLTGL